MEKSIRRLDLEALSLLRAFAKISDRERRREIIVLAEKLASSPALDAPLVPDKRPNETDP